MSALRNGSLRALTLTLVLAAGGSRATTHTWTGVVSSSWMNNANWVGGSPANDVSGSIQLLFPSTGAAISNNDVTGLTLQTITFTGPAANSTKLTGNAFILMGGLTVDGTVPSGSTPSVALPLILGASQSFTVTNQAVTLKIDGSIAGGVNAVLTYGGAGSFEANGNNDYNGPTILGAGVKVTGGNPLFLGSATAGTTVQAGAYLELDPAASGCAEPLTMEGSSYLVGLTGVPAASTFNGPITFSPGVLGGVNVQAGVGEAVTLGGSITGGNGIAASGGDGSVLILTQGNDYSGPTTLSYVGPAAGVPFTVLVHGVQTSSAVTVGDHTVLGGKGSVGSVDAQAGSTVSPGASPGILSIGGNLTMASTSTLVIEMIGTSPGVGGYDQVGVSGSVNLGNAALNVVVGFSPGILSPFTIIHNIAGGPVIGTFAGLPDNAGLVSGATEFRINYNVGPTNDVVLTTIGPPPSVTASPAMSTYCPGGTPATLTATPSGGAGPYTYQWYQGVTPVGTASTYGATAAGTYTVTVTDSLSVTSPPSAGVTVVLESTPPVVTAPSAAAVTQTLCM